MVQENIFNYNSYSKILFLFIKKVYIDVHMGCFNALLTKQITSTIKVLLCSYSLAMYMRCSSFDIGEITASYAFVATKDVNWNIHIPL